MKTSGKLPKYIEQYIENPEPGVPKRQWRSSKIAKLFKKNSMNNWELALEDPEFKEAHKNYYRRETTSGNDGVIFEVACQALGGALQLKDAVDEKRVQKIKHGSIDFYVIPSLHSTETYGYERLHTASATKAIDQGAYEVMARGLQQVDSCMPAGSGALELEDGVASGFTLVFPRGSEGAKAEEFEEPSGAVKTSIKEIACSLTIDCKEKHTRYEYIFSHSKVSESAPKQDFNITYKAFVYTHWKTVGGGGKRVI